MGTANPASSKMRHDERWAMSLFAVHPTASSRAAGFDGPSCGVEGTRGEVTTEEVRRHCERRERQQRGERQRRAGGCKRSGGEAARDAAKIPSGLRHDLEAQRAWRGLGEIVGRASEYGDQQR